MLGQGAARVLHTEDDRPFPGHADYTIFRDSGRTQNWGNIVGTDNPISQAHGTPVAYNTYATLPAAQLTSRPGAFSNTIIVTITY